MCVCECPKFNPFLEVVLFGGGSQMGRYVCAASLNADDTLLALEIKEMG